MPPTPDCSITSITSISSQRLADPSLSLRTLVGEDDGLAVALPHGGLLWNAMRASLVMHPDRRVVVVLWARGDKGCLRRGRGRGRGRAGRATTAMLLYCYWAGGADHRLLCTRTAQHQRSCDGLQCAL